jgi:hypothetical protein
MAFWNRKKVTELPALPPINARFPSTIISEFNDAVFGTSCRTLAYKPLNDSSQTNAIWRKAVRLPHNPDDKKWCIYEIKEKNIQHKNTQRAVETPNQEMTIINSATSFFEAIESLALFEQSPFANPQTQYEQTGKEAQSLTQTYYKTLANIEGIIFDLDGNPCPTLHGETIVAGNYASEDISNMRKLFANRKEKKLEVDNSIVNELTIAPKFSISLEKLKSLNDNESSLLNLVDVFEAYSIFLRYNIHHNFTATSILDELYSKDREDQRISLTMNKRSEPCYEGSVSYYKHRLVLTPNSQRQRFSFVLQDSGCRKLTKDSFTQNYLKASTKMFSDIRKTCKERINELDNNAQPIKEELEQLLNELDFVYYLAHAKHISSLCRNDDDPSSKRDQGLYEELMRLKEAAQQSFIEAGGNADLIQNIETSLLSEQFDNGTLPWERYDSVINSLETIIKKSKKMSKSEWKGDSPKFPIKSIYDHLPG